MKHAKAFAPVAALALFGVSACNAGMQTGPATEALDYMRAHPVPAVAGTVPAVILTADVTGFRGAAAQAAQCPASLTAHVRSAAGSEPACGAWSGTAETVKGQLASFTCGSVPRRQACPLMQTPDGYIPAPGTTSACRCTARSRAPATSRSSRNSPSAASSAGHPAPVVPCS